MYKLRKQITINSKESNEDIDFQRIIEIKDHLLELSKNEDRFDKNDVIKYVNDTNSLRKFIRKKYKFEDNVQLISNILYWRKESGLTNLTLYSFPRELYSHNGYYFYDDSNGNLCAVIRAKYFVKGSTIKEMCNTWIYFICYFLIDKLNQKSGEFGLTMIADFKNISITQYDFEFLLFMIDLMTTKLPDMLKKIIIYEVPWFAIPLVKTALLMLPNELKNYFVYANVKTIKKYVSPENLPEYMPESTRKEPIEKLVQLDETKSLKEFTEKELNLIGMKKENIPDYFNLLAKWKEIDMND